jgi:hypothetical protein
MNKNRKAAEPATTDNDYDCPSRGGAALWASHSHV